REAHRPRIEELTLEAPLVLTGDDPVGVQLVVGPPDHSGHRPLAVYARPDGGTGGWTRHASALLTADGQPVPALEPAWPPVGAEPVPMDPGSFYAGAADRGY